MSEPLVSPPLSITKGDLRPFLRDFTPYEVLINDSPPAMDFFNQVDELILNDTTRKFRITFEVIEE